MHIHGNAFNYLAAAPSAAQELKAAEARRAAEVRKKLLKGAAGLSSGTDEEETLFGAMLHGAVGPVGGRSGSGAPDEDDSYDGGGTAGR